MGILFGLFVLVVLIVGLANRRKQNKAWLKEERRDESGAWVDKRAGERGTYGSLDAEMEQERSDIARQGRANELARLIRDFAFEHHPDFHTLSDAQIRIYSDFAKKQAAQLFAAIEKLLTGQALAFPETPPPETAYSQSLKKRVLDFSYQHFPALLDLDIETLKLFDRYAANLAAILAEKIEEIKD